MPTGRGTGFIELEIVGRERGVQAMLERVDSAFSVVGIAAFLHGSVHPWLLDRAKDRFASEGDDVSGKWAPLKPATIEFRESQGFGPGPINRRTGELEEYITGSSADVVAAPGVGTLRFPGRDTPTKSIKKKMQTAQRGSSAPSTVARPVLGLNENDLGAILVALAFHIKGVKR